MVRLRYGSNSINKSEAFPDIEEPRSGKEDRSLKLFETFSVLRTTVLSSENIRLFLDVKKFLIFVIRDFLLFTI